MLSLARQQEVILTANNQAETTKSSVLHRSLHENPALVSFAKGNIIHLENGQEILDATGGAAVSCLGHGNQIISEALTKQSLSIAYCHSLFYAAEPVEELANVLIDSTCGDMSRAFFVSGGSEAIEAALKFARQYHLEKSPSEPGRVHFISRRQSYHGSTLGALGAGGHAARRSMFEPLLATECSRVSPCFAYRPPVPGLSTEAHVAFLEQELEEEFQRVGPNRVAAFITEPVVGAALGCVPPLPGYFKAMRRVCDRHGALLIMDEIMAGCGRIGPRPSDRYKHPLHAYQDPLIGIVPDILTMGKGLGAGYQPIAAMLISKSIVGTFAKGSGIFGHGQTYQSHPVACRAALEVQRIIRNDHLIDNVRDQGHLLGHRLRQTLDEHPNVGDIRGMGLFWGIEFVRNKKTKEPFELSEAVAFGVHQLGLRHPFNICLYPGTGTSDGHRGDHVLLAPAFNCTAEDIELIVRRTALVINAYFAANAPGIL